MTTVRFKFALYFHVIILTLILKYVCLFDNCNNKNYMFLLWLASAARSSTDRAMDMEIQQVCTCVWNKRNQNQKIVLHVEIYFKSSGSQPGECEKF